jgi:hypothetical protein
MRKIRDVLRLHADGLSKRNAASLSIGVTTADASTIISNPDLFALIPQNESNNTAPTLIAILQENSAAGLPSAFCFTV